MMESASSKTRSPRRCASVGGTRRLDDRTDATLSHSVAGMYADRWKEDFKADAMRAVKEELARETAKRHGGVWKQALARGTRVYRREEEAKEVRSAVCRGLCGVVESGGPTRLTVVVHVVRSHVSLALLGSSVVTWVSQRTGCCWPVTRLLLLPPCQLERRKFVVPKGAVVRDVGGRQVASIREKPKQPRFRWDSIYAPRCVVWCWWCRRPRRRCL
jgi:hypothetical protein